MCTARSSGRSWCHWSCVTGTERSSWVCSHPSPGSGPELDPSSVALPLLLLSSKPLVPSPILPLPAPDPSSLLSPFSLTLPAPCHAPGQMWKALPEAEKAKYKVGLTPLPASGRGGSRAWVRLPPALGRVHPPLPVTPAPSPKRAAPSAAPTAPPIAPPAAPPAAPAAPPTPLLSEFSQILDEPTGLGTAPAAPPALSWRYADLEQQLAEALETQWGGIEIS